jgi:hypothetical protein
MQSLLCRRVFRLHHVHARLENSKKRQKAKMPENFVPGPAKWEKKEKGAEKAEHRQPDKAPDKAPAKAPNSPAKTRQPFANLFEATNKQPPKKPASPAIPKPPPGMDKNAMDAIRRQVEVMRASKKGGQAAKASAESSAKARKPPSRQDQLLAEQARELQQIGSRESSPSGWASGAPSEVLPGEESEESDEEGSEREWTTVVTRKKGKAPAKAPAVNAPTPAPALSAPAPTGMSRKQAKRQAYMEKVAAMKATQGANPTPVQKAEPKPPAKPPTPAAPAPLFNAWGKPQEEQPQASLKNPVCAASIASELKTEL